MEQTISSLAFKGSILEAINEAKRQKKLFLVYISGENEDSISMDKSTWSESSVAESLSKYCILLHILEGSTDAAQFSALYPQKPAPCITAIGYNGIQLWQNEGFVSGEILSSTVEKAWLSLHVQETTATFLSAALASRQSEQIPSETPPTTSREIGTSSSTSSTNTNASTSVDKKVVNHNKQKSVDDVSHEPLSADKLEETNITKPVTTISEPVPVSGNVPKVDKKSILKVSVEGPQKSENLGTEKVDNIDFDSNKSNDVYLNIRLPGGASLQEKFEPLSTLRMVKEYVDEKKETSLGAYDLAIPYPRKVFTDQDLSKTLSELSLVNRQALIVVPRMQSTKSWSSSIPNPSVSTTATSSSPDNQGYFSYWKNLLSYVNPLAYLTPANPSTPVQETANLPESGSTQGSRRSYLVTQNQSSSSRFGSGSNIHTLKRDEDDSKFNGKNAFWNGNSTEYGGDGDNK